MGPWQTCGGAPQTHAASGGGVYPRATQQWGTRPPCPGLRARVVQLRVQSCASLPGASLWWESDPGDSGDPNLWQQGWASGGIFLKLRAAAWTLCPPALMCTLQGLIRDLWGVEAPLQKAEGAVGPASWLDNHGKRPLPLGAGRCSGVADTWEAEQEGEWPEHAEFHMQSPDCVQPCDRHFRKAGWRD